MTRTAMVMVIAASVFSGAICADAPSLAQDIGWANLLWPPSLHTIVGVPSPPVYGQVWIDGLTEQPGPTPDLVAELGIGPWWSDPTTNPWAWYWVPAEYNLDAGPNDEFMGFLIPFAGGLYQYCYRYSYAGSDWVYGDLDGSDNGYSPESAGSLTVSEPTDAPLPATAGTRLYPCQPNPFNPRTSLRFHLAEGGPARLAVYDIRGRLVRTLVGAHLEAGSHQATWDGLDSTGRAVSAGIYFARLEAGREVETVRMGLVR